MGKVMTYSTIISAIWGTMDDGSVKKLQVNMANIRKNWAASPARTATSSMNWVSVTGCWMPKTDFCQVLVGKKRILAQYLPPCPYNEGRAVFLPKSIRMRLS